VNVFTAPSQAYIKTVVDVANDPSKLMHPLDMAAGFGKDIAQKISTLKKAVEDWDTPNLTDYSNWMRDLRLNLE
jgi:hypothetical protein